MPFSLAISLTRNRTAIAHLLIQVIDEIVADDSSQENSPYTSAIIRDLLIRVVLYDPLILHSARHARRAYIKRKEAFCCSEGEKRQVFVWKNSLSVARGGKGTEIRQVGYWQCRIVGKA